MVYRIKSVQSPNFDVLTTDPNLVRAYVARTAVEVETGTSGETIIRPCALFLDKPAQAAA